MTVRFWARRLFAVLVVAAVMVMPGLPVPGAERFGLSGTAAAQYRVDIDYFYDELEAYGEWAWHPRYGYVWLPEDVSPYWRPYTYGRWIFTSEYGWYWDSREPFAWAVYHYGRWGYDPAYGWFWVPGDVWAPAWVTWRYSDDYVGWAPIGPRRTGYAWGGPAYYDAPVAEAWVFVRPRFLTSRTIYHHALPVGALGPAFFAATMSYRPEFRGGIVFNYGPPRDRLVGITRQPIVVQKVFKVDRKDWRDRRDGRDGIRVFAPGISRGDRPGRGPRRYVDNPRDFKPKAVLRDTYRGDLPKGWGPSARNVAPITKEAPDAFRRRPGFAPGAAPGTPSQADWEKLKKYEGDRGRDTERAGRGPDLVPVDPQQQDRAWPERRRGPVGMAPGTEGPAPGAGPEWKRQGPPKGWSGGVGGDSPGARGDGRPRGWSGAVPGSPQGQLQLQGRGEGDRGDRKREKCEKHPDHPACLN